MPFKKEIVDEYLAKKGNTCPFCGSDHVLADFEDEKGDGHLYMARTCGTCGQDWVDKYKLVDCLEDLEESEPDVLEDLPDGEFE